MKALDSSPIKAILFDVYGTLVEIRDKRAPFRRLIQIGAAQGRAPDGRDAELIMGQRVGLLAAAERLGIRLGEAERQRLDDDLHAELASVAPFADTLPALHALRQRGFKLALCSNLALDYAAPVLALLPFAPDAQVWSFDMAAIKPAPSMYAEACRALGCRPGEVLMVGDTVDADVDGPRAFGMQALLLDRKGRTGRTGRTGTGQALPSLAALCEML